MNKQPTPVTVVSGFLGSGKTTLMNTLLGNAQGQRLAVLVNDFGELNIDESLIAEVTDNVQALTNGCICCSMQGELIEQIGLLATREPRPDHILIECSGVSEPARIMRTLGYPELKRVARLDSVTTVVDPTILPDLQGEYADLARAQIGAADLIILNKTDLVSRSHLSFIRENWLTGQHMIIEAVAARIPANLVLDSHREIIQQISAADRPHNNHGFDTWNIQLQGTFQLKALRQTLENMPRDTFRLKGCIALAERPGDLFWINWVGGRSDIRKAINTKGLQSNWLVVISRRSNGVRNEIEKRLEKCLSDT